MKASKDCYECLQRLAKQAAGFATNDEPTKAKAIEESLRVLKDNFSHNIVTIIIATKIHDVIRAIGQNPDPYRGIKDKEITVARELFSSIKRGYGDDFRDCLKLAALGNAIDFFRPLDITKKDIRGQVSFVIDDSTQFETKLKNAKGVMYLADNAGEVFFDLPLVRWMRRLTHVIYVVKASPVQDDITLEDIRRAGVEVELGEIITTGTATPGIDFSLASTRFKHEFTTADLIFAKGMGYYESLSELPAEGRIFYCLMAKCKPVADSLKVPMNSYVAMLR